MSHDSADTRVTAYVFGELSEDQHKAFEQELAQSSQLRDEVASVEEAVAAIRAELDAETTGVDATRRKEIEQAIGDASTAASTVTVTPAAGGPKADGHDGVGCLRADRQWSRLYQPTRGPRAIDGR